MKRRLRWTQVDEQEHATSPETPASGEAVRDVVTSRGAGWAVAAAMAGAVVGLSVAMATSSSPTIVAPGRAAGPRGTPAGPARAVVPAALRAVSPGGRVQAQPPARLRIQAPARVRLQIPAAGPLQAPARLRTQVPAAGPLQAPAQLRLLAPVPEPAGTLIPLPRAAQVLPGRQAIAGVVAPRTVRLRVRPGQVRVRLRVPASGRLQVLPGGATARPLRVVPGPHPAALVPAAPARLRIAFRNGKPVPVRLLIPAGRARLRIQLPARARIQVPARIQIPVRARIQVPARARITPARPAPPSW